MLPKTKREVFDDDATIHKNYRLVELLGDPQNRHPAVHVAGTSGKGTICYLIDALLRAHSKRTGMTQSPHVYDIRERIQINGQFVSERKFVELLGIVLQSAASDNLELSYFEVLTAMVFTAFGNVSLDYTIIETGFGGRLDATNVIQNSKKVCVLAQIGLDHVDVLGNTVEKIAVEKAGIVQPGNIVVALKQDPAVNAVFEKRCNTQNATLVWVEPGADYQQTNDRIALTVCEILAKRDSWIFDESLATSTLQQVFIPGRFEKRQYHNHLTILDGAHNPQKFSALAERIKSESKAPVSIVLSVGERKDLKACLSVLQPITRRIIATEYFTKEQDIPRRPVAAEEIVKACTELGIEVHMERSPEQALRAASKYQEPIVITGSFYLVGELDKAF